MRLKDKVAIVTGGGVGIGKAYAHGLAKEGAKVVVADIQEAEAQKVAADIKAAGGEAIAVAVDVISPEKTQAMAAAALKAYGRIDILVNNAGITRDQLMLRLKREDWDAVIATNLTSAYSLTQAVLKPMIRQRSGRIICISSVVGQSGNAGQANYAASKAGLIGLAKSVALEVASRNITVNVVAPGMIATDMTGVLSEKTREALIAKIPVGRLGDADDIAAAVCFLASDEAAYITGQVLAVNGGMYL